jgi:hypothetical protein
MVLLTSVSVAFMTMTTVGLLLRLYTRKFVLNLIWIDDYLAVVSWVCKFPFYFVNEQVTNRECSYRCA